MKLAKRKRELLKFNVQLDDRRSFVVDLLKELTIDQSDVNTELATQAARYSWIGVLYELSKSMRDRLEHEVQCVYAELDDLYRVAAIGKITENTIKQSILSDRRYRDAMDIYLNVKEQTGLLFRACVSIEMKKDLLMALNANLRAEREEY